MYDFSIFRFDQKFAIYLDNSVFIFRALFKRSMNVGVVQMNQSKVITVQSPLINTLKSCSKNFPLFLQLQGNTAIHYCISHCNFEITGLLLDSEICDINKANKAGYTPIMLAGLATLQCTEQMQMVSRLFSVGDVNARAQAVSPM